MTLDADLGDAIGERYVLVDPSVTASYETDWTRRFAGPGPQARPVRRGPPATVRAARMVARALNVLSPTVMRCGLQSAEGKANEAI